MSDKRLEALPLAPTPSVPDAIMWAERDTGGGTYVSEKIPTKIISSPVYLSQITAYTSESGDRILPDNSVANVTINLPATPLTGDSVYFRQVVGQLFSVFSLTVGRNGETIMNDAEDMIVTTDNASFYMTYNGTTWVVIKDQLVGIPV